MCSADLVAGHIGLQPTQAEPRCTRTERRSGGGHQDALGHELSQNADATHPQRQPNPHLSLPAGNFHIVPDTLDDEAAVLVEPTAAACETRTQVDIGPRARVGVVGGGSTDEPALIDHCREVLAHFKCPTSVEFRDELSRTATGKLQKFKLRAPYWEGMEKQIN